MIILGKVSEQHRKAIDFFDSRLLTRQQSRHVIVEVKFTKKTDYWGSTSVEDYNKSDRPRHFIIEVNNKLSKKETLITIAHELVHVKQYVKNELNEEMSYWHGKKINLNKLSYSNQPWEVEAYQLGEQLYHEYQFSAKSTSL